MFLFRADGNPSIGAGHVMRCLSIAEAAREASVECVFVTAGDEFCDVLEAHGYKDIVLGTDYRDMLSELPQFVQLIEMEQPVAVFVDSYYVSDTYLNELKRGADYGGGKLVYLDDVLMFPYPCDILLNYNIYANEREYRELFGGMETPKLLLGTEYAPLRREFAGERKPRESMEDVWGKSLALSSSLTNSDNNLKKHNRKVFVSTGGADFEHLMVELVKSVKVLLDEVGYEFHFVLGSANEDREIIMDESYEAKSICLHENVIKMAELMRSCDVAISAAGSTLYELCACRIPTITYILADNQIRGARCFEKRGIMKCAGDIREIGASELASRLIEMTIELCGDEVERYSMAEKQEEIVDGIGAERIVDEVMLK